MTAISPMIARVTFWSEPPATSGTSEAGGGSSTTSFESTITPSALSRWTTSHGTAGPVT